MAAVNWNITYSPVWKWLVSHGVVAALVTALTNPQLIQNVAGPTIAPVVTALLGAATAAAMAQSAPKAS